MMRAHATLVGAAIVAFATEASAVVQITVEVNPPRPVAGIPFQVNYGLRVQNDSAAQGAPMRHEGLQLIGGGAPPSTANMMVFGALGGAGNFTMETSSQYVFIAPRAGRFTLGNLRALDPQGGRVMAQHADVVINVLPAGTPMQMQPVPPQPAMPGMIPGFPPGIFPPGMMAPDIPPPPPPPSDPDAPPTGEVESAIFNAQGFVRLAVDNPTPYVGEQTTLRVWLYVPANEVVCDAQREPQLSGFWNEPLIERGQNRCARQWFVQVVGGRQMNAGLMRKIALFPTRAGRQEIGNMEVVAEYIEGDGFFGQRRQIDVRSPSVVLEVREQPAQGRPAGYIPGTIGPMSITAELDRATAPTGETVTLRVRAQGNGYLGAAGLPPLSAVDGLRMHPGTSHREIDKSDERNLRGTLTQEYLLVAERPGAHALGTLRVPWFDAGGGRYQTATVQLPTLTATGAALERDDDDEREDPAVMLDSLTSSPSLTPHWLFFTTGARVWGTLSLPPVGLALMGLARALKRWREGRRAEEEDTRRNDPMALMGQAESALAAGDEAKAADLTGRCLERARREYRAERLDEASTTLLAEAQTACDTLRFGGAGSTRDALEKVRAAVLAMERAG